MSLNWFPKVWCIRKKKKECCNITSENYFWVAVGIKNRGWKMVPAGTTGYQRREWAANRRRKRFYHSRSKFSWLLKLERELKQLENCLISSASWNFTQLPHFKAYQRMSNGHLFQHMLYKRYMENWAELQRNSHKPVKTSGVDVFCLNLTQGYMVH